MKQDLFGHTKLEKDLAKYSGKNCEIKECNKPLSVNVFQFSTQNFGNAWCMDHQKEAKQWHDWANYKSNKDIVIEQEEREAKEQA